MAIYFEKANMQNYQHALEGFSRKTNNSAFIQTNNFFGCGPMPMMPQPPRISFLGGFGVSLGTTLFYLFNRAFSGGCSGLSYATPQGQSFDTSDATKLKGLQNFYSEYKIEQTGDGKYSVRAKDGDKEVILSNASLDEISETLEARHKENTGSGAGKTQEQLAKEHTPELERVGNEWVEKNDHSKKYEFKDGKFSPVETQTAAATTQPRADASRTNAPEADAVSDNAGTIPAPPEDVKTNAAKADQVKTGADIVVKDYGENGGTAIEGAKLGEVGEADSQNENFPKTLKLTRDGKTISYNLVGTKDGVAVYQSVNGSQKYFLQNKDGKLELMQPSGAAYLSMGAGSADNPEWQ